MNNFWIIGKLAIVMALGVCVMAGCGVSSRSGSIEPNTGTRTNGVTRGTSIGQIAPDFDLEKTGGGRISFKDLDGTPAVLVFWTAWCPVCREEVPKINRLADEFESKGVKVVAINIGESEARVAEGIKDFGIKYAVARDTDTAVSRSYKVIGTPTIVFLNKNGEVQFFGNELPKDYAEKLNNSLQS